VRTWLLIAFAGLASACLHDERPATDRATGVGDPTQEIVGPALDRCQKLQKSGLRQPCDDAKYLAQKYARGLSPGDQVCLEGGFGDSPGAACLARAKVNDVGTNKVLFHVAETEPGSRWYKYIGTEVWFYEPALVDLYLAERGY
jgi:hypothetical protein